jgi:hypothetical protein
MVYLISCIYDNDKYNTYTSQSHPARDAHDTFFMKSPAAARDAPEAYYERVKKTHEDGGESGSIGYGCVFKREEAMKNLLRTHTTAISAQMLYKLGQEYQATGQFSPKKYFSIDRYESMGICVYVSMCLCVYESMCLCVYVSMCLCVYVSMCLWVYVSIPLYPTKTLY